MIGDKKVIAIVPARGGSKGLPCSVSISSQEQRSVIEQVCYYMDE